MKAFVLFLLLFPFLAHASARLEYVKSKDKVLLEQAISEAEDIEEGYDKSNEYRYLAEILWHEGNHDRSLELFDLSYDAALSVHNLARRLSAFIGLFEIWVKLEQDISSDKATELLTSNLFNELAAKGSTGEVNRLITALSGVLKPSQVAEIMNALSQIEDRIFRTKILFQLAENKIMEEHYSEPKFLANPPENELEKMLYYCVQGRIYEKSNDPEKARAAFQNSFMAAGDKEKITRYYQELQCWESN
jgi:hypothetical protein